VVAVARGEGDRQRASLRMEDGWMVAKHGGAWVCGDKWRRTPCFCRFEVYQAQLIVGEGDIKP
jgi:hypothetical protein